MAIVVSHVADDFAVLCRQALRQAPLADLIELRLDRIGHPGKDALAAFCREARKPVIVACHAGDPHDRLDLLHDAAEAGARFVDVDWTLSLDLGEVRAPCHRIVSRHEDDTPDDLEALAEEVRDVLYEGDVTKIVTHAATCEDGLRLLAWLRSTKGIVAFAAGEAGRFTRLLAPIFGSPFTYCAAAALPGEPAPEPTAPGQIRVNDYLAALPPGGISQETAILGVVGRPVAHSFSPWVHGMALKAARLDAVYVAFEPADLAGFLALANDENYRGFSVTAPFKEAARALAFACDGAAEATGAANTLLRDGARWRGANTDVAAIRETLERALALRAGGVGRASLAEAEVLVLGAGGAARAAVRAVLSAGARATVAARRWERAEAVARELGCRTARWEAIPSLAWDVLVHATPAGSLAQPDVSPVPAEWLHPGAVVLDAVYRPIKTPLLRAALERGCTAVPGGEWFVRQAALQFELLTNTEPDEPLIRKAFEHAWEAERARA